MKRSMLFICAVLCAVLFFAGCSQPAESKNTETKTEVTEDKTEDIKTEVAVSMSDWEGTWNNMGAYLDDKELEPAFETLAKNEGQSPEEAKADYVKKRKCDFDGFVVKGDQVTLLDNFQDKGGNPIDEVEYAYVTTHKVKHGNHDIEWYTFKAKGDAKYKILLMMPVHGEEALTHFHLRYGDDEEQLLAEEGWYPTFVKPTSTHEQLIAEITE